MQITSLDSTVIVSDDFHKELAAVLAKYEGRKVFVFVDENTKEHCLPLLEQHECIRTAYVLEIPSGEEFKSIESVTKIWNVLQENGADRKSLVVNLGGGLLCDMGGFGASTFKRGLDFINIPTTLLAQVDASIGGKLGINFNGLKNEVGIFHSPNYVLVDSLFLRTLGKDELYAGYAEMIKHALIYNERHWKKVASIDLEDVDYKELQSQVSKSIFIKNDFVKSDPKEKNIRKALNFGHTVGHAFESFYLKKGVRLLHGNAVAHGMICELALSYKKLGFEEEKYLGIAKYILDLYTKLDFTESDFQGLYDYMKHDKKNEDSRINFTLLSDIGEIEINVDCTKDEVFSALEDYRKVEKLFK